MTDSEGEGKQEGQELERDYQYLWHHAYLLPHLVDRLHEEQRNIFEHNPSKGLTGARGEARKKLEDELTDDEYQATVDEIATARRVAQRIIRENMLDETDHGSRPPTPSDY